MNRDDKIMLRTFEEAVITLRKNATIRQVAEEVGVSKSTVQVDLAERLPMYSSKLARKVRKVHHTNWNERTIRGGEATRQKYLAMKKD